MRSTQVQCHNCKDDLHNCDNKHGLLLMVIRREMYISQNTWRNLMRGILGVKRGVEDQQSGDEVCENHMDDAHEHESD